MNKYAAGFVSDLELLGWYLIMGEAGDIEKAFNRGAVCLSVFMQLFEEPTELYFERDEQGWTAAAWLSPLMGGATFSLWIRADQRQSRRRNLTFVHDVLRTAFEKYPVLIYVTREDAVKRQGERLGFHTLGSVPYLFDGESAYVGVLTPFMYESAQQESSHGRENP